MPCNSQYLEANAREVESRKVAELLVFVLDEYYSEEIPRFVTGALGYYGDPENLDALTEMLCARCQTMDESFIYDGRKMQNRRLADWWDRHQEWDRIREAEEKEKLDREGVRKKALKKLTKAEREALGL